MKEIYLVSTGEIIKGYFVDKEDKGSNGNPNVYEFVGTHMYKPTENKFESYYLSRTYTHPSIFSEITYFDFYHDCIFTNLEHARVSLNIYLLKKHREHINKLKHKIDKAYANLKEQEQISKELSLRHTEYYI